MASDSPRDLDLRALRFRSIHDRAHKVEVTDLGTPTPKGCSFRDWLKSLPNFLGVQQLNAVAQAIVAARKAQKPVVLAFGGHVVKTGCGPLVIDLMERGIVTAVATNGSGAIHDLELAQTGATSEEVADAMRAGNFGMVFETCQWMNEAARIGVESGLGAGVGAVIEKSAAPHRKHSIFAAAFRKGIPATVHVAIGTDTVHVHPDADGAAIGAATLRDFRTLCTLVASIGDKGDDPVGGVWLNFGSAVLMPEVFLKAVAVARNLGYDFSHMQTANFDMIRHYRPVQNVVTRPVVPGHGHHVTGHHELTLPLLRQAVLEYLP